MPLVFVHITDEIRGIAGICDTENNASETQGNVSHVSHSPSSKFRNETEQQKTAATDFLYGLQEQIDWRCIALASTGDPV